jgi:hypothetical protein
MWWEVATGVLYILFFLGFFFTLREAYLERKRRRLAQRLKREYPGRPFAFVGNGVFIYIWQSDMWIDSRHVEAHLRLLGDQTMERYQRMRMERQSERVNWQKEGF